MPAPTGQEATVWTTILQIGSLSGLVSLLWNTIQGTRKSPQFKFYQDTYEVGISNEADTTSAGTQKIHASDILDPDDLAGTVNFTGMLCNASLEVNSLIRIYVWQRNLPHTTSLHLTTNPVRVSDDLTGEAVTFPRSFAPRQCLRIRVKCRFTSRDIGSASSSIGTAIAYLAAPELTSAIDPRDWFISDFVLVFQDVNNHFFDQRGRLLNPREMVLRMNIPKASELSFWMGQRIVAWPRLYWGLATFRLKALLVKLGFWK